MNERHCLHYSDALSCEQGVSTIRVRIASVAMIRRVIRSEPTVDLPLRRQEFSVGHSSSRLKERPGQCRNGLRARNTQLTTDCLYQSVFDFSVSRNSSTSAIPCIAVVRMICTLPIQFTSAESKMLQEVHPFHRGLASTVITSRTAEVDTS